MKIVKHNIIQKFAFEKCSAQIAKLILYGYWCKHNFLIDLVGHKTAASII